MAKTERGALTTLRAVARPKGACCPAMQSEVPISPGKESAILIPIFDDNFHIVYLFEILGWWC